MTGNKKPPDPHEPTDNTGRSYSPADVRTPRTSDRRHRAPESQSIAEGIRTLYG